VSEKKKELQLRYDQKMREMTDASDVIATDLKNRVSDLIAERERSEREDEALLMKMEEDHEQRLHQMNEAVRAEVAKREDEKELLSDAIQTERVRSSKLKKMLLKYSSNG
jgi:hypothetical protein